MLDMFFHHILVQLVEISLLLHHSHHVVGGNNDIIHTLVAAFDFREHIFVGRVCGDIHFYACLFFKRGEYRLRHILRPHENIEFRGGFFPAGAS